MSKFVFGTMEVLKVKDSDDIYLIGIGKGEVVTGDEMLLTNRGDDEEEAPVKATVKEVSVQDGKNWKIVERASDSAIGLRLTACEFTPKVGTVVFTEGVETEELQNTYISALGDSLVSKRRLDIEEYILQDMSIADLSEAWRLNDWYNQTVKKEMTEEEKKENSERLGKLCTRLCKKITDADAFYCVYSTVTKEPYLFSKTYKRDDGYVCTPANIRIIPACYRDLYEASYDKDKFELRLIETGDDREGIMNFLGTSFYINGAVGLEIVSDKTAIGAEALIQKPDYKNIPKKNIPATNPEVVRWLQLLGQVGTPATADEKLVHNLYFEFLAKALKNARLVVPVANAGKDSKGIGLLIQKNEGGRDSIRAYTDWKHLLDVHKEELSASTLTLDVIIKEFDVALNVSPRGVAGCYITKDLYEKIQEMSK